jgi:hypothetical protein
MFVSASAACCFENMTAMRMSADQVTKGPMHLVGVTRRWFFSHRCSHHCSISRVIVDDRAGVRAYQVGSLTGDTAGRMFCSWGFCMCSGIGEASRRCQSEF